MTGSSPFSRPPAETASLATRVLADGPDIRDVIAFYTDLHRKPELSEREYRTADEVAKRLASAGAEVSTGVGGTGVVAMLRNGPGPVVMIRGDMDGLPVAEETGLEYASTQTAATPEGQVLPVMHACGHDVHTAVLAATVQALCSHQDLWRGTLMAVAQPAEEIGQGARAMLCDGLYERFAKPDIALGQHVEPFGAGHVAHAAGLFASAALSMDIRIFGNGGHASQPEMCVDPVVVAASIVIRLQTIVSREIAPDEPAVVTVGSIHAGEAANVIPDEARLAVNIRFQSEDTGKKLLDAITRIAHAESEASHCPREPTIATFAPFPLVRNDAAAGRVVRAVHEEIFGSGNVYDMPVSMGSEDFSEFGLPGSKDKSVPYCFWTFGGYPPQMWDDASGDSFIAKLNNMPGTHTARFAPEPEAALRTGLSALTSAALAFLAPAM